VHSEIFIGGATSAAKRMKLNPLSKKDFDGIKKCKTKEELHRFIKSFY
jgi:hypothetical protein